MAGGLTAAETDHINVRSGNRCGGGFGHGLRTAGFVGRHLHHPHPRLGKDIRQQRAPTALNPRQQHAQPEAGHGKVLDQAVGHKARRDEIGRSAEVIQ